MTATRTDYAVRPYTVSDEPAVLQLLEASLQGGPTGQRTAAFFRWKHEENPFGPSFRLVAEQDGKVIGFRSFLRWQFLSGGEPVLAVRAVDTATHPDHQGRGIFTRLTLAAVDALRGDVDLIFNTPNAQSRPGYLKMGWSVVGSVPLALRPVRPVRLVRGCREAFAGRGAPSGAAPPCPLPAASDALAASGAVTALLAEARGQSQRLTTARSLEYLQWRYAGTTELDYRAVTVHDGGALMGLAIGRPRRRGPLNEFLLAEVIARGGDRRVLRELLRAAAHAGGDHVVTHLPPATVLAGVGRAAGYLPAPGVGIGLVANPLTPAAAGALRLPSWRLSLGDLELF